MRPVERVSIPPPEELLRAGFPMRKTSEKKKTPAASPGGRSNIIIPVCALIALILSVATFSRNILWHEETRLWEDIVTKNPGNAKARNNLAFAYSAAGAIDKAIDQYRTALLLEPDNEATHFNLGVIYLGRGLTGEAAAEFKATLRIHPCFLRARQFLDFISRERK